jgi:hypothetical protein
MYDFDPRDSSDPRVAYSGDVYDPIVPQRARVHRTSRACSGRKTVRALIETDSEFDGGAGDSVRRVRERPASFPEWSRKWAGQLLDGNDNCIDAHRRQRITPARPLADAERPPQI